MDNYFHGCPPMMDDGRLFTDYRSSAVREEIFRYKNCITSENEARTLRINTADEIMDEEWDNMRKTKSCFTQKKCYHTHPTSRVTTFYNNAEILAYNGKLPAPPCEPDCHDYRLTITPGSKQGSKGCKPPCNITGNGYPLDRRPGICSKTKRMRPDRLYDMDGMY